MAQVCLVQRASSARGGSTPAQLRPCPQEEVQVVVVVVVVVVVLGLLLGPVLPCFPIP
mgnify:CR=1 FL=1